VAVVREKREARQAAKAYRAGWRQSKQIGVWRNIKPRPLVAGDGDHWSRLYVSTLKLLDVTFFVLKSDGVVVAAAVVTDDETVAESWKSKLMSLLSTSLW